MWRLIDNKDWDSIWETFSWVRDMEGVIQSPIYHEEGDVAVHTRMVMEALFSLPEYKALDEQDQEILFAAVLLHDVEKRSTTVVEPDGRITSRGHAKKGEYTARTLLYKAHPAPFAIKEAVAKLVRYHGLPVWIFEKPNPRKYLYQASLEVDTRMLGLLAKADMMGRICPDQHEILENIKLFEAYAQEQDCFGKPKAFASDLGRYTFFQKEEASPDYAPFEKDCFEVIMFCALPGTGKDTFIKKHFKDLPMVSIDALRRKYKIKVKDTKGNSRMIQMAKEEAKEFLRKRQPFVWNATNITRNIRSKLIDLFQTYGAKTKLIYLEVPFNTLLLQNRNREYPVPEKVIEKMIARLEIPAIWEAPLVEYHAD